MTGGGMSLLTEFIATSPDLQLWQQDGGGIGTAGRAADDGRRGGTVPELIGVDVS
jgi:hypothetical protein